MVSHALAFNKHTHTHTHTRPSSPGSSSKHTISITVRGESSHASESTIKYLSLSSSDFDSMLILLTAFACCNTYWSKHGQSNIVVLFNALQKNAAEHGAFEKLRCILYSVSRPEQGKLFAAVQQELIKRFFVEFLKIRIIFQDFSRLSTLWALMNVLIKLLIKLELTHCLPKM